MLKDYLINDVTLVSPPDACYLDYRTRIIERLREGRGATTDNTRNVGEYIGGLVEQAVLWRHSDCIPLQ